MTEIWLPIIGFEGFVEVSNMGRIRSLDRTEYVTPKRYAPYWRVHNGKILEQARHPRGYMYITLSGGGKKLANAKVHHLVLNAFVGPCPDGLECCHRNDIPDDNRLTNLRWDTQEANRADKIANSGGRPKTCRNGHEYTPGNVKLVTNKRGTFRSCLTCRGNLAVTAGSERKATA